MKKKPRNEPPVVAQPEIQTFLRYLLGDPDQFWDWTYVQSQKFDFYYTSSNLLAIRPTLKEEQNVRTGKVNIFWDIDLQAYRIQSDYNVGFKDDLKSTCGKGNYAFDAVTKTWSFTEPFLDEILRLVETYYDGDVLTIEKKDEVEAAAKASAGLVQLSLAQKSAITFVAHLDRTALDKAFKTRAATLHPDAGGNGTEFAEFNSAYQALRKEMK